MTAYWVTGLHLATTLCQEKKVGSFLTLTRKITEPTKQRERPMSRSSLITQFTPFFISRIRHNQRLLSSSSALLEPSSSSASSSSSSLDDAIQLTDNCIRRMKELRASEGTTGEKMLRLGVETGGCSGFQYVFDLENKMNPDDRVFEREGVKLVVDDISYDFVKGATVDYVEELIRSAFVVTTNPSAVGGCSCKISFMVKQ